MARMIGPDCTAMCNLLNPNICVSCLFKFVFIFFSSVSLPGVTTPFAGYFLFRFLLSAFLFGRLIRAGYISCRRYTRELYDNTKSCLLYLRARIVNTEVVEAPLVGRYNKLCAAHPHRMLLWILVSWCKS